MGTTVRPFDICTHTDGLSPFVDNPSSRAIDLSIATGLKDATLWWEDNPRWVAMTLRTITRDHRNFQRLLLETFWEDYDPHVGSDGHVDQGWLELDSVLAQLWESHSIRPRVIYNIPTWIDESGARLRVESLLPEVTSRGIVDLTLTW